MSNQFGDDKDVLKGPRKDKLSGEEVAVPLRDQVVGKLMDSVEDEELPTKIKQMWDEGNSDRAERLDRLNKYLAEYDQFHDATIDGPFTIAGDIHLPTTYTTLKTVHARFLQATIGIDPPLTVKARHPGNLERELGIQQMMEYYITSGANYGNGIIEEWDKFVWAWAGYGLAYGKWRWDRRFRKFIDVQEVTKTAAPLSVITPDGTEQLIPQTKQVEEEVERVIKSFDGPVMEYVPEEDILLIGSSDPQTADAVIHRQYLTADDLWQLVDQKVFDEDAVEEVIHAGKSALSGDHSTYKKQIGAMLGGESNLDKDYIADRYEILEAYMSYDVHGSGINSEIIVWIHKDTGALLRATYLDRVDKRGLRPVVKAVYQPREDSNHPLGLIEMLEPLSREVDFFHNLRVDFGFISTVPFGFYRPTSSLEAEKMRLEPGMLYPTDNPQTDVYFPNIGNRSSFGAAEESAIKQEIERLTSISDLNLGVLTGAQGATRTATGARALLGETSSNLDVFLRRLNRAWGQSMKCLFSMLQQRVPEGLAFRLLGEDGMDVFREVKTRDEIQGEYDFIVAANSASSNKQVQIETASQVLQLTADPLAIQLGIVTPLEYFEARKNFLRQLGVKDFGKFLKRPPMQRLRTPMEELDMVMMGMQVDVTPEMDHAGFIQLWETVKGDDGLLGQFNEDQTIMAEKQSRAHAEMLKALEQMQAQQANFNQQQANAAQSSQQTAPAQPEAQQAAIGSGEVPGGQ